MLFMFFTHIKVLNELAAMNDTNDINYNALATVQGLVDWIKSLVRQLEE